MKFVVLVPAFNEAKVLGRVIRAIPRLIPGAGRPTIIVIDDGSTDGTDRVAQRAGAMVLRHLLNRGKGVALSTGFLAAKHLNASLVATLDADGQHDPGEISKLVAPILKGEADLVIGSRLLTRNGRMPLDRLLINKVSNILTRFLSGVTVTDSQSGYRAFSRGAIDRLSLTSHGFEVETEMLTEARRKRLQIAEVPIKTIYTPYSRSKGQRLAHGIMMTFRLMVSMLRGYR